MKCHPVLQILQYPADPAGSSSSDFSSEESHEVRSLRALIFFEAQPDLRRVKTWQEMMIRECFMQKFRQNRLQIEHPLSHPIFIIYIHM